MKIKNFIKGLWIAFKDYREGDFDLWYDFALHKEQSLREITGLNVVHVVKDDLRSLIRDRAELYQLRNVTSNQANNRKLWYTEYQKEHLVRKELELKLKNAGIK